MKPSCFCFAAFFLTIGVGSPLWHTSPAYAQAKKAAVDLNKASEKELEDLEGVGPATAKKIIAGRPYKSVDDLAKAGVPKNTIEKIRSQVTVGAEPKAAKDADETKKSTAAQKSEKKAKEEAKATGPVDLNRSSQQELEGLSGVGPATAKKIIAGRPYKSVDDLEKAGVSKSTVAKIRTQVTVGGAGASTEAASTRERSGPASSTSAERSTKSAKTAAGNAAQNPPAKGMVWVNTDSKIYHYEGDRWYGKTKQGKYMTEADAKAAGYRASKESPEK
jgi:competence protein ComEA